MMTKPRSFFVVLALFAGIYQATAQGTTAFTYQGQLHDGGTNANGAYTMTFKLYDSLNNGNQIGSTMTTSPTLANGLFTVNLDFGTGAFNGNARWLDITVQSGSDIEELAPRVQVLPTPYAQFAAVAATVTNGAIMNAQLAANAVAATNIANGQVVKSLNGLMDSVSLSAGANVALATNGNVIQISSLGGTSVPNGVQIFAANGTFVVPGNVTRIMVEMWGGGGGGGGSVFYHKEDGSGNTTNVIQYGGGGGGSGGYAVGLFSVTPGASYPVTAGDQGVGGTGYTETTPNPATAGTAGASSSFGSLLTAYGGGGGSGATISGNGAGGSQPNPATGSVFPAEAGNLGYAGLNYGPMLGSGSTLSIGGKGGDATRGGNGGLGGPSAGAVFPGEGNFLGEDGQLGGGGGGGGGGGNGGNGGNGVVIITY